MDTRSYPAAFAAVKSRDVSLHSKICPVPKGSYPPGPDRSGALAASSRRKREINFSAWEGSSVSSGPDQKTGRGLTAEKSRSPSPRNSFPQFRTASFSSYSSSVSGVSARKRPASLTPPFFALICVFSARPGRGDWRASDARASAWIVSAPFPHA